MVRLNLALSKEVRDRIESIRDETHAESIAEVIRRAVAVYDLLIEEQQSGGEVLVRNGESESRVLLVP
ncbi:hypothetical protein [Roseiconus lacunae]|uniref:hypothetical protein n=1 Tax=Roseiconus lacunae TaxID=2605694 RepID=UPI001E34D786|nr:hypothetical protein [Roseiconus lacunae]MCD0460052.1 hypothetical protein [Roseiconus lacunae]